MPTTITFSSPPPAGSTITVYFGSKTSRFTRVFRVNYPMVPSPPSAVTVDTSVPLAPVVTASLPTNFDRNIYGVVVFGPPASTFCSTLTFSSSDPNDHRTLLVLGTTCTSDCNCSSSGAQTEQSEFIILNGTTPVTTTLLYGSFISITPYGGLLLQDNINAWADSFAYLLGPNGNLPLYRMVFDSFTQLFQEQQWRDSINFLLAGTTISLSLSETLLIRDSMADNLLTPASLLTDSINLMQESVLISLNNSVGGGTLRYLLIINEHMFPGIKDGVAHFGEQTNLSCADVESANWLDNVTKLLV